MILQIMIVLFAFTHLQEMLVLTILHLAEVNLGNNLTGIVN